MNKKTLNQFLDRMTVAVLEAGQLAKDKQEGVINIGKKVEFLTGDNEVTLADRQAKTIVDEEVQELLLKAALEILDGKKVKLDAEEETYSTRFFSNKESEISLVIDPIDGTREYIDGENSYSINVGLLERGKVMSSIVYFPGQNYLYFIRDEKAYFSKDGKIQNAKLLAGKTSDKEKLIYVNIRVSSKINQRLEKAGYKVIWKTSIFLWSQGILKTLTNFTAAIFHTPQIRDVLLGAILSTSPGGYAVDWKGKKLIWPAEGRIPRAMFGVGQVPEDIIKCLKS